MSDKSIPEPPPGIVGTPLEAEWREIFAVANRLEDQNAESRGLTELLVHFLDAVGRVDVGSTEGNLGAIGYLLYAHQDRTDTAVKEAASTLYRVQKHKAEQQPEQ